MESFSDSRMPYSRMPISSKTSIASLRTGPRQTIRHLIVVERERAQPGRAGLVRSVPGLRSRSSITRTPAAARSSAKACSCASGSSRFLREHAAGRAGHHDARHRAERQRLLRVHQLALVALRHASQLRASRSAAASCGDAPACDRGLGTRFWMRRQLVLVDVLPARRAPSPRCAPSAARTPCRRRRSASCSAA